MPRARDLHDSFVHLGLGATAVAQPAFTGMDWYADYITRHGEDGAGGGWSAFIVSLNRGTHGKGTLRGKSWSCVSAAISP